MNLNEWLTAHIQLFLLVFFRVISLFLVAPIFGNRVLPVRLKVGFGIFMAIMLMPLMMHNQPPNVRSWANMPVLLLQEGAVGCMIGLIAGVVFAATHLSGEMLGRHMGFGMARLIDPEFGGQISVVAQFENLVALLLFLSISGHHLLVMAMCDSFDLIPIGGVRCDSSITMELIRVVGRMFPIAIKITAPAFVLLILTTVIIGLVARCAPQMNVLIIGLPLKIGVGLIGLAACVPMFSYIFEKLLRVNVSDIYRLLEQMH